MKKIPWKGILIGCTVMTVLVLARCIATVCMELYYGRTAWMNVILQDGWFYVGIAAASVSIISGIVCLVERKRQKGE